MERDGSLTLAAPEARPMDRLRKFAESRRFWVYVQLAKRDPLHRDRVMDGPAMLRRWYIRLGQDWLSRRVQRLAAYAGVGPPPIQIQDLG